MIFERELRKLRSETLPKIFAKIPVGARFTLFLFVVVRHFVPLTSKSLRFFIENN